MIDNYKDLNIGKFMELRNIDTEDKEEIDLQVAMIAVLAEMTEEEVMDLPLPQYREMVAKLSFLMTPPEVKEKIPNKVILNGKEYEVVDDVKHMRTGQFIDYQHYISQDDTEKMLPYILSCFIIPKGKTYGNDYNLDETVEEIKNHLPINIALGIARFFFRKLQSLTRATLTYLAWTMRKKMRRAKTEEEREMMRKTMEKTVLLNNLVKSGDGFQAWILSAKH